MNKVRRESINAVIGELEELSSRIEDLQSEEESYRDNVPENLQGSERYQQSENAIENLESACSFIRDSIENLESIE